MPTNERKQWRAIFTDIIMELADGKADVIEAASWAIEAQYMYGDRDPREAASETFRNRATADANERPQQAGVS